MGASGVPGVSIAILSSVALSMNIPVEGMVIILGVDRLLDMCRTAVNVTGDLTAALLLRYLGGPESAPGTPERPQRLSLIPISDPTTPY